MELNKLNIVLTDVSINDLVKFESIKLPVELFSIKQSASRNEVSFILDIDIKEEDVNVFENKDKTIKSLIKYLHEHFSGIL